MFGFEAPKTQATKNQAYDKNVVTSDRLSKTHSF